MFMSKLSHTDSYIYLASVNGLCFLSDIYPDDIIPCLSSEFRSLCLKDQNASSTNVERTLKVGETLVKATRRLGKGS